MVKNGLIIFAIALLPLACSRDVSRIQTRSLATPNPTNYTFSLSLQEVQAKAWEAFSIEHQVTNPIFGPLPASSHLDKMDILVPECATNAAFGEAVFRDPANTNDLYLHSMHSPFVYSPVYFGKNGGLPFIAAFHLHFTENLTNTIVSITAEDTEVVNGTKFGFGPCGPGMGNNYVKVQPTTVEEYSILRYLGNYLRVTNMPPLVLPKN
jgi:hypothetical protein